jgi:hypothetical protein
MIATIGRVMPFTHDDAIANEHGADQGIRRRVAPPFSGEVQCAAHVHAVICGHAAS